MKINIWLKLRVSMVLNLILLKKTLINVFCLSILNNSQRLKLKYCYNIDDVKHIYKIHSLHSESISTSLNQKNA